MGCCGSSERYALKIEVLNATGLPDVDIRGKCDPFVEVQVEGCDPQKTEIKKNEQDPVWNQTMIFEDVRMGKTVHFKVMDWDRLTSNDFIGGYGLGQELPDKYNEEKDYELDLINDGDVKGKLFVKITFIHEKPE